MCWFSLTKWWFGLCLVAVLAVVVRTAAAPPDNPKRDVPPALRGTDWPRFLGPAGDSKSLETGILTEWRPNGPPVVWHRKLGISYGIGSVAGGRFFQFDRHEDRARLTCLDARTGKFLWKSEYPTDYEDRLGYNNGPRCSPVIDEDRVYLYGAEGMLSCVRAQDGKPLWKVDTVKKFGVVQNFFGVGSTPVVYGDLLLVMVGGSPSESQGAGRFEMDRVQGNGTGVVAFDKHTGEVKYKITDELASYSTPQLSRIGSRPWCFVLARGGLVGFDPLTGKVDFHYPWRARLHDSVNASTPVVVGDEVFISEAYGPGSSLLRVKPGSYEVVWSDPPGREQGDAVPLEHADLSRGIPVRLQRPVFQFCGASLRGMEEPARCMWSQPGLGLASLLYVDGHLICLSEDGVLRLVKATEKQYVEVAKAVVREGTDGPPLIKPPGVGSTDPFARPALRSRGGPAGVSPVDSRWISKYPPTRAPNTQGVKA